MTWWMWLVVVVAAALIIWVVRASDFDSKGLFAALCIAVIAGLVIVVPMAIREQNEWEQWCVDQGGHVIEDGDVFNTINFGANGQPGVGIGFNADYYCLSDDGQILGIYG